MSSNFTIKEIRPNEQQILNKVTNDRFGLKAATEWKKLIGPYTPRDTGRTEDEAVVTPWKIRYDPVDPISGRHYARDIYEGIYINFQKTHNPYATHHWDMVAEQADKKKELYRELNNALKNGSY